MSTWRIVIGALTSEVFWGINLACTFALFYPPLYAMAIFLAEGTFLKPILLVGLYAQCVLGAVIGAFNEYVKRKSK